MSTPPFISICLPAYRAEKYLEETLATVRAQSFSDWELIVTEDGSKDRTEEMTRAFAQTGPQPVRYDRHPENRGLPATRNTGIRSAQGRWIAILDADDLWLPDHLAQLAQAAQADPSADLVYAGSQIFDSATGAKMEIRAPTPEDLADFPLSLYAGRFVIQPSSVMFQRAGFDRFGPFSTEYPICNDFEYWLRFARGGGRFRFTGSITCLYRKHAASLSGKTAALIAETGAITEAYADWAPIPVSIRRRHPSALYRYAGQVCWRAEPKKAQELFGHSLRLNPWSPRVLAYWLVSAARSTRREAQAKP